MRHCFGETVEVYEVTGNKVSKILKKAGKKIRQFEEDGDYGWYSTNLVWVGDAGYGYDYCLTVYAHA